MRKHALATVMLVGICIISCGLPAEDKTSQQQKLEKNIGIDLNADSIKTQILEAEAELKSFLEEDK